MYLNNRHYDPQTGVFVSVDPLVTKTMQPYIYGAANPVTFSDPSGLDPDTRADVRAEAERRGDCTYSSSTCDPARTRLGIDVVNPHRRVSTRNGRSYEGGYCTAYCGLGPTLVAWPNDDYHSRPPSQTETADGPSLWDRATHSVRFVANSPVTSNGWLWAELNGGDCGFEAGLTVVCTGTNAWANGSSTLLTLGNTIITDKETISQSELGHEDEHSTQWAVLGPLFVPTYVADSVVNGRCPYLETSAPSNPRYASC